MTVHSYIGPRISGALSATSCAFVIYLIIIRSGEKLSTIYHRIVFGMCCVSILSSIACSLASLPLPRNLPDVEYYNSWDGVRLGNARTCQAQGFFVVFGFVAMFAYNSMLCLYYFLHIAMKLPDKTIRKYFEFLLHFLPISGGLIIGVITFDNDLFNPSGREPWCTVFAIGCFQGGKKVWCDFEPLDSCDDDSIICYKGDYRMFTRIPGITLGMIAVFFASIFVCFSSCILKVYLIERELKKLEKIMHRAHNHPNMNKLRFTHGNTKIVLLQSLAYTVVFTVTLGILFLRYALKLDEKYDELYAFLAPSTGFFTSLIFVGHKVFNYRRCHQDESLCSIFHQLCFGPPRKEPVIISCISIIERDERMQKFRIEINGRREIEKFSINDTSDEPHQMIINQIENSPNPLQQHAHGAVETLEELGTTTFPDNNDYRGSSAGILSYPSSINTPQTVAQNQDEEKKTKRVFYDVQFKAISI